MVPERGFEHSYKIRIRTKTESYAKNSGLLYFLGLAYLAQGLTRPAMIIHVLHFLLHWVVFQAWDGFRVLLMTHCGRQAYIVC